MRLNAKQRGSDWSNGTAHDGVAKCIAMALILAILPLLMLLGWRLGETWPTLF